MKRDILVGGDKIRDAAKMASLCKRQQCTIERRGFRQELDSWRHKLIHCVGFESILEGLFGPGLVKDLTIFQGNYS
uniref:Uncharacterized protein n=1 Tax=Denticeps clupeoides TaxID=299321 RepID=A0AAY4A3W7_9TELE